jgi:hypothetical protein
MAYLPRPSAIVSAQVVQHLYSNYTKRASTGACALQTDPFLYAPNLHLKPTTQVAARSQ